MKYVCLVFSDHDCDRLKNQGTSTIWYKFSGQAGTRLPTCDQVDSYMVQSIFRKRGFLHSWRTSHLFSDFVSQTFLL